MEHVGQPVVQNVQENLAKQMNPVVQENVQQAAQKVVENVEANIQPEMVVPQAQKIVQQAAQKVVENVQANIQSSTVAPQAQKIVQQTAQKVVENVQANIQSSTVAPQAQKIVSQAAQKVVENVQANIQSSTVAPQAQKIVQQAAQQVVENVQANIQPSTVAPQAQKIVNQAVNQVNEVVSQATNEAVSEAVNLAESVTEKVAPPIVEKVVQNVAEPVVQKVVEPIVTQSPPIIETSSEAFQASEAPVIEPQVTETVSEMVSEAVTEAQTEVTTLLTSDESPMISKLSTADYLQWAKDTHLVMTISISMAYLFIILLIRRLLLKRSPFHLRSLLFLWNLIRVVIHIAQTVILVRLLAPTIKQHSKHIPKLLCHGTNGGPFETNMETIHFWINLFTFVKLIELVDTLFVVLRKQQLTLSHTYYRITSLIYAFFIIGSKSVPSYYPIMVLIHVTYLSIMSFYYLVRSRSIIAPKWIRYTLNLISLIEATGLLGILSFSIYQNLYKEPCSSSMSTDVFGFFTVGTNTILFINYLRSTVIKPKTIKLL